MARSFKEEEAEDLDLNQLVDMFLNLKPDYLPVFASDGTLLLLPYAGSTELCDDFYLCPELPETGNDFEPVRARNQILM
jgi:hypothetical protein